MDVRPAWSFGRLMRVLAMLWGASAVVAIGLTMLAGDSGWDLTNFLIGFGILAVAPALWLILAFGLATSRRPGDEPPTGPAS